MRIVSVGAAAFSLALCSGVAAASSFGDPADGFINNSVQAAFIPLSGTAFVVLKAHGAAFVLAPGIAVTNAHNANMIDSGAVIGRSKQHDLLFFRTDRDAPLDAQAPQEGEHVVAYGEGENGELRVSHGVIRSTDAPVKPHCDTCDVQKAFTFESNAGPGFSGGPVLDADDGHLVGITFGYLNDVSGDRLMYAYDMNLVQTEFSQIETRVASVTP
jgi:S1-C subfamily serine protease